MSRSKSRRSSARSMSRSGIARHHERVLRVPGQLDLAADAERRRLRAVACSGRTRQLLAARRASPRTGSRCRGRRRRRPCRAARCAPSGTCSPAGTQRDLLRPHADADRVGAVRAADARAGTWSARRRRGSRRVASPPSTRAAPCASTRFETPRKLATNAVLRALVEVGGRRRPARSCPSFMTAIVSAIDHGLLLIVRHVHERDADVLLDPLELDLQLLAQAQVERAERLVEQQRARAVDQRAGERDALLPGRRRAAPGLRLARWPSCTSSSASATRACGPRPWRPSCAPARRRRSSRRSGAGTARRTGRRC